MVNIFIWITITIFYNYQLFLGFKPNEGEYKVMGLAPYGTHLFHHKKFDKLIKKAEGGFELNMDYFSYPHYLIRLCLIRNYLNYWCTTWQFPCGIIYDIHKNISVPVYTYRKTFF